MLSWLFSACGHDEPVLKEEIPLRYQIEFTLKDGRPIKMQRWNENHTLLLEEQKIEFLNDTLMVHSRDVFDLNGFSLGQTFTCFEFKKFTAYPYRSCLCDPDRQIFFGNSTYNRFYFYSLGKLVKTRTWNEWTADTAILPDHKMSYNYTNGNLVQTISLLLHDQTAYGAYHTYYGATTIPAKLNVAP